MSAIANPAVLAASHGYRRLLARRVCLLLVIGCALLGSVLLDLSTGSSGMGLGQLLQGLLHPQTLDVTDRVIIWNVRLPYALMAVLVGAALSLAGAEMQAILHNPLASPFTLGVSSAAALGASLVIVFPLSSALLSRDSLVALAAFVFACASMFLLHGMSRLRGAGVETLVLFGIALVFSCNALVALLQLLATEDVLQQLVFWSLGSVARANYIAVLREGAVVAFGAAEQVLTAQLFAEVYGVRARVERCSQQTLQVVVDSPV